MQARKAFFASACGAALLVVLLAALGGCAAQKETWSCEQDDSLSVLTTEVAGGAIVAQPGNGWALRDGYIQLQLGGGSIPGQTIKSVQREGNGLTVTVSQEGDVASLDLVLTEYRITGTGDISQIEALKVDYGNGEIVEVRQLEQQD